MATSESKHSYATQGDRPIGRPVNEDLQSRRRAEILRVSTSVFAENGFAATDVQVIADRVGVGKGTVYRYFPSKEELFLSTVDFGMIQLQATLNESASDQLEPLERIAAGFRSYLTFFDQHPEIVELLIQERAHFRDRKKSTYFVHKDANIEPWRVLIRDLIAAGIVRDIPAEHITDFMSNVLYGALFTNYFSGGEKSLSSQANTLLELVMRSILVERSHNG